MKLTLLLLVAALACANANILNEGKQWEMQHAEIVSYVLCGIGIVVGLIFVFFGYRLFRPVLGIAGFVVGCGICFEVLYYHTHIAGWLLIGVSIVAGIIVAVVSMFLVEVGIFVLGAVLGFLLLSLVIGSHDKGLIPSRTVQYILMGAVPFASGVLALIFQKFLIILATAFAGSYAVIVGIDRFVKGGFSQVIPHMIADKTDQIDANYKTWIEIGACVVLFLIGTFIQFKHTSKNYYHKHTRESGYSRIGDE
jgi:hypothetical protein